MAKHCKKQPVYYNNGVDGWTNESKGEFSLMPGSDGYKARQEQLRKNSPSAQGDMDADDGDWLDGPEHGREKEEKDAEAEVSEAFEKGIKSPASQQYRARMQAQDEVKEAADIVSEGLGRSVSEEEIRRVSGAGLSMQDDVPRAVKAVYEEELKQREIPVIDRNGDGVVNEDDADYTPGMRRMRRYFG